MFIQCADISLLCKKKQHTKFAKKQVTYIRGVVEYDSLLLFSLVFSQNGKGSVTYSRWVLFIARALFGPFGYIASKRGKKKEKKGGNQKREKEGRKGRERREKRKRKEGETRKRRRKKERERLRNALFSEISI